MLSPLHAAMHSWTAPGAPPAGSCHALPAVVPCPTCQGGEVGDVVVGGMQLLQPGAGPQALQVPQLAGGHRQVRQGTAVAHGCQAEQAAAVHHQLLQRWELLVCVLGAGEGGQTGRGGV